MSEELEKQKEAIRQQHIALNWMRRHIYDYSPCQANSELLGQYLEEHGLSFSEDSLDLAAEALGDKLGPATVKAPAAVPTPATPAKTDDGLPPAPQGQKWPSTRAEVAALSRSEFRNLYHSKRVGEAFRRRLEAIYNRPEES